MWLKYTLGPEIKRLNPDGKGNILIADNLAGQDARVFVVRANLGYRWAYSSSVARLSKFYPEKPSRKLRASVAKTTFVSNAQSDNPRWTHG